MCPKKALGHQSKLQMTLHHNVIPSSHCINIIFSMFPYCILIIHVLSTCYLQLAYIMYLHSTLHTCYRNHIYIVYTSDPHFVSRSYWHYIYFYPIIYKSCKHCIYLSTPYLHRAQMESKPTPPQRRLNTSPRVPFKVTRSGFTRLHKSFFRQIITTKWLKSRIHGWMT